MMDISTMWQKMYYTLFHGIVDAENLLPVQLENAPAAERLNKALLDAEDIYIQFDALAEE